MPAGYSAQEQGLEAGDVITGINGRNVHFWDDISLYTLTHPDETSYEISYERDGEDVYCAAGAEEAGRRRIADARRCRGRDGVPPASWVP